ncbi:MAG: hydrogenase nickel incorporation protein HypB [Clostridia bacterium]|nr:hydrogenase nickel incorporation protein HypB [Clostridia bacterium]
MTKEIEVVENIFEENDRIAAQVNKTLTENKVFCINVLGAPGVGKTSVMKRIAEKANFTPFVIEGDIESDIDTETLNKLGIKTVQINTHGACHLDAPSIQNALTGISHIKNGVLFIENIGNLVCPAEFNIGEHAKMLIVSTTDGSDKPYKYPLAFEKANLIILNKCDLTPYLDFDYDFFLKGVLMQNKNATVISVSAKDGDGFDKVVEWIENNACRI